MNVTERQNTRLLLALLLWYVLGRVLQLFAGKIPNLLIVVFHVVPVALFALIHGARLYRARGISVFIALCLGVSSFFESISLRTGFPFGHYRFTNLMGPKVFQLPLLLALAYVGMGYLSWIISLAGLRYQNRPLSGIRLLVLPLTAGFVMTVWDVCMDPIWSDIDHAWIWQHGGSYFGVPVNNFLGWFLTVYLFYQIFALYLWNRPIATPCSPRFWNLAFLFYAASAIGNLFVVAPASLGVSFVDDTGRYWRIADILWTSRLLSVFLMGTLCLILWVHGQRDAVFHAGQEQDIPMVPPATN